MVAAGHLRSEEEKRFSGIKSREINERKGKEGGEKIDIWASKGIIAIY